MAALWLRLWLVTIPQRLVTIPKQKKMETNRKMSKHTPGPWTVAPLGTIEFKGGFIGEAYDMNPGYYGEKSEDLPVMANARLMAAAPEMLELLQALTGFDSIRKAHAMRATLKLLKELE